jgi:hypothetical protein
MQEADSATVVMESGTTAVCRTLLTNDVGAVGEERWDGKWKHHLRFRRPPNARPSLYRRMLLHQRISPLARRRHQKHGCLCRLRSREFGRPFEMTRNHLLGTGKSEILFLRGTLGTQLLGQALADVLASTTRSSATGRTLKAPLKLEQVPQLRPECK